MLVAADYLQLCSCCVILYCEKLMLLTAATFSAVIFNTSIRKLQHQLSAYHFVFKSCLLILPGV